MPLKPGDDWSGKQVVVTGAGGFIGSHLTERLVNLGASTTAFLRYNSRSEVGLLDECPADVRKEIDQILQANASAPFGGLAGEKFVNVLEVNLELSKRYGVPK